MLWKNQMNFWPICFLYFSPRYKIYHLVYFNCLISFISLTPLQFYLLAYSQRGKKTHIWSHHSDPSRFPSSPFHAMIILRPRVSFPSPPQLLQFWTNCHLFEEAFVTAPTHTHHEVTVTAPHPERFSHWYTGYFPLWTQGRGHIGSVRGFISQSAWNTAGSQQVFLK